MKYESSNEFIKKLETDNFEIGSFDVYLEKSSELMNKNKDIGYDSEKLLSMLPTTYRASIVSKKDRSYIGFIGVFDVDSRNDATSIIFETNKRLSDEDLEEIISEYKEFLDKTLNLRNIKDLIVINDDRSMIEHQELVTKEATVNSKHLESGVSEEDKEKYKEMGYSVPNLQMAYITNLLWSNKRANLQVFFDKEVSDDFIEDFGSYVINEYLELLHENSLYSISSSISGSDKKMINTIINSGMDLYAAIPYASTFGNDTETNYLFQHYPDMEKQNGIYLPENKIITNDNEIIRPLSGVIDLGNGYIAMNSSMFEDNNVDIKDVVKSHISAMQNRDKYSIPLGEDKYFIQEGNGKYGMSRAVQNFSYIILDENMKYVGYTNILRANAKNAEIEMALSPDFQSMGIGSSMLRNFYEELFDKGYMSVTSQVFDFNKKSNGLSEKLAKFNGKRIGAYYINGKLWDMNIYTKEQEDSQSGMKR